MANVILPLYGFQQKGLAHRWDSLSTALNACIIVYLYIDVCITYNIFHINSYMYVYIITIHYYCIVLYFRVIHNS